MNTLVLPIYITEALILEYLQILIYPAVTTVVGIMEIKIKIRIIFV